MNKTNSQQSAKATIEQLTRSYWMELETVQNYLANSVNLVGVLAEQIKQSLAEDVTQELGHARRLAERIHVLGGSVPGSMLFQPDQQSMQPPDDCADVVSVIHGVIDAETAAIEQYNRIIKQCEGTDYVTQDLCIQLLADEEQHRREFYNYLAEYERGSRGTEPSRGARGDSRAKAVGARG